jgi:serine/threonine protein kinase
MGNLCSTTGGDAPSAPAQAQAPPRQAGRSQQPETVPNVEHKMRKGVSVRDVYKVGKTIGTGGFSVVKLATDKETGQQWACKIMSLPPPGKQYNENESSRADIFKEIDILIALKHDNIVFMKGAVLGGWAPAVERLAPGAAEALMVSFAGPAADMPLCVGSCLIFVCRVL